MILADSSVWIDYFNGQATEQTDRLDDLLSRELVVTGDLILMEVMQGFRSDKVFRTAKALFEPLECYTLGGPAMALAAAQNFRRLRRKGVTVRKSIDVLIATWCIENAVPLLHGDRDFDVMVELGLEVG